jgi:hypothetical protein
MTYLIARANYDNYERGEEYSPTHFILEIDKPLIKYLRKCHKNINKMEIVDVSSVSFYFGFGIWAEFDEWLDDSFQEELTYYKYELPKEFDEQDHLTDFKIKMFPDGDMAFICYGKYDNEEIYTCLISLEDIEAHL